jgi:phosphonate transport system substrate-binding protein
MLSAAFSQEQLGLENFLFCFRFFQSGQCEDAAMVKQPHSLSIVLLVATLMLTAGLRAEAQTKPETSIKTLTLGAVFQDPREPVEEHFRPLANYVARKLSPSGETKGTVVVAPSAAQMMKLLEEKRVDFYMESPYPTYLINHLGAATLLLRRWKGGMAEYRSLIFTGKESGIARLEDLRGKFIAFEDPGSTSGYFLPKLFLLKKGFSVVEKPSLGAKVGAGEIGYIFTGTGKNVVNLVLQKNVAAGAFSNDDHASLDERSKAAIAILGESELMPRHLVSVRKDLPEPVKKRLKEILLSMHRDDEGQKILSQTGNTTKFDALPGGEELVRRKLVELYRPRGNK